jgi:glutathione S-transferase
MLVVHHLGRSQSERIVWLCEELGLDYELRRHERDPLTGLGPPELKALHPMGTAPVIIDGPLVLAESGAIVAYIIAKYGNGRLSPAPDDPAFAQYLYWFHFANATLQSTMGRNMFMRRLELAPGDPTLGEMSARLDRAFGQVEKRLAEAQFLAGSGLSAADIMLVFCLSTMRLFLPLDLAPYPSIRAYLRRIGSRPAYQAAMRKGDPGMAPCLS